MPLNYLFSKRNQKIRDEIPDIIYHDILPNKLRNQINYIIVDTIDKLF
ncbi:MAG TPA: hypothetical protein PKD00_06850 [Burkholderiales bacterium]|nr:hypothetical protein [Burkholderiales bacterium]